MRCPDFRGFKVHKDCLLMTSASVGFVPQKLEQIIVVALKKNGMQRDHVCFRKCYNRLFNLSKSFLKVYIYMYMNCICSRRYNVQRLVHVNLSL